MSIINITEFNLEPMGVSQKSFYGKAKIRKYGESGVFSLISYGTEIAAGTMASATKKGTIHRIYDNMFDWAMGGWSATSAKHLKAFSTFLGIDSQSKKEWTAKEYTTIGKVLAEKRETEEMGAVA